MYGEVISKNGKLLGTGNDYYIVLYEILLEFVRFRWFPLVLFGL